MDVRTKLAISRVGATPTTDATIVATSSQLYTDYKLRRVYYTADSPTQRADSRLPLAAPPLVREHHVYEADWLIRHSEFRVDELTTADAPHLDLEIDPKRRRSAIWGPLVATHHPAATVAPSRLTARVTRRTLSKSCGQLSAWGPRHPWLLELLPEVTDS